MTYEEQEQASVDFLNKAGDALVTIASAALLLSQCAQKVTDCVVSEWEAGQEAKKVT